MYNCKTSNLKNSLKDSDDHLFVFSFGSTRNGYHHAAATSETVFGLNSLEIIFILYPCSNNLIPVDKPETPAPTIVICMHCDVGKVNYPAGIINIVLNSHAS